MKGTILPKEERDRMARVHAKGPLTKEDRTKLNESVKSRLGPTMRIEELTTDELLRIENRHAQLAGVLGRLQ